jgi:hypothetical protein
MKKPLFVVVVYFWSGIPSMHRCGIKVFCELIGVSNSWKEFGVTFDLFSYLNIIVQGYVISLN